jgi:hypothetical protein
MSFARLYCMIVDESTGFWFGLDRGYRLLIEYGDAVSANQIRRKFKPVEGPDSFFPSEEAQAPRWAWYAKATSNPEFAAYFFKDPSEGPNSPTHGVPIGGIVLKDTVEVVAGRMLEV